MLCRPPATVNVPQLVFIFTHCLMVLQEHATFTFHRLLQDIPLMVLLKKTRYAIQEYNDTCTDVSFVVINRYRYSIRIYLWQRGNIN